MWFATWDGLYTFDGYKLKRVCQPTHPNHDNPIVVIGLTEGSSHEIWMQTSEGIYIWDDEYQKVRNFKFSKQETENGQSIVFLEKDHQNKMWFMTYNGSIYTYDLEDHRLNKVYHLQPSDHNKVQSFYIDDQNHKWICSSNTGIFKLEAARGTSQVRMTRDPFFEGFEEKNVFSLFKDSQSHFWVATPEGIYRMNSSRSTPVRITDRFEIPQQLSQKEIKIHAFAESESKVYAATSQGLFSYDKMQDTAEWMITNQRGKGLNDKNIRSVTIDREGGLWLATFNGGVNYLSPTAGNFSGYAYINEKLRGHVISGIAEDQHHNLWFSTDDGGLSYWNRSNDEVQNFGSGRTSGISPTVNNIQSIYVEGDRLYLGMFGAGMDVIDLKTKSKKNYHAKNTAPSSLPNSIYGFHRLNETQMRLQPFADSISTIPPQNNFRRSRRKIPKSTVSPKMNKGTSGWPARTASITIPNSSS